MISRDFQTEVWNKLNSIERRLSFAGGGSIAPVDAEYVVMSLSVSLTQERRLQATEGIALADGGAGGDADLTLDVNGLVEDAAIASGDFLVYYDTPAGDHKKVDLDDLGAAIGGAIDHGALLGLGDDDHTQYVRHNLSTAGDDFLVGSGANTWIKKTVAETRALLGGVADNDLVEVDLVGGLIAGDIVRATAAGIESRTDAQILAQLSGDAGATFDWNDQRLEKILSLEVKDLAVNTADDYIGLYNHHKKTAGASDINDDFYAHENYAALDQVGGTIGYLSGFYTECFLIDGTVGHDIEAIFNKVVIQGGIVSEDVIGSTDYILMTGGAIDDLLGHFIKIDIDPALTITGNVYGHYISADIDTDPTGSVYMVYLKEYSNVDYGFYQDGSALNVLGGALQLDTVANAAADVDKFLVLDVADVVDYRTGAEVLDDIGGISETEAKTKAFELDVNGDYQPVDTDFNDYYWDMDGNDDIMPEDSIFQMDADGDLMPV